MQWASVEGVFSIQWTSSQNDNYSVWVQLAWVTGTQVSHEIQGPVPSPSWAMNQRNGKSSPSPAQRCQGDPFRRARVSLLSEMKQNWRQGERLGISGWLLGARAALYGRDFLGPHGTHWPYFSKTILLLAPLRSMRSRLRTTSLSTEMGGEGDIVCTP